MAGYTLKTAAGEHGPISEARVRELAATGQLQPDDMVRSEHDQHWRFAREIRGYSPPQHAAPSPPPTTSINAPELRQDSGARGQKFAYFLAAVGASALTGTVVWAIMYLSQGPQLPRAVAEAGHTTEAVDAAAPPPATTLDRSATNAQQLWNHGYDALQRNDLPRAEELFAQAAQLEASAARHHVWLAEVRAKREDHPGAAEAFGTAIQLDPKNSQAWGGLGDALLSLRQFDDPRSRTRRLGNPTDAFDAWETAASLAPGDFNHTMKLLMIYETAGAWERAVPLAEQFVAHQRSAPESDWNRQMKAAALRALAVAYDRVDRDVDAASIYSEILELEPQDSDALVYLARRAVREADPVQARRLLRRVNPQTAESHFLTATVEFTDNNQQAARRAIQASLRAEPDHAAGWRLLGAIETFARNLPAAIRALEKSLELEPGYAEGWYHLARLLADTDRLREAISAIDRAVAQDGMNGNYRLLRAELLLNSDRFRKAAEEAGLALKADAEPAATYLVLGQALAGLRSYDEAALAFRRSIHEGLRADVSDSSEVGALARRKVQLAVELAAIELLRVLRRQEKWEEVAGVAAVMAQAFPAESAKWREQQASEHVNEAFARRERGDTTGALDQFRLAARVHPIQRNIELLSNALGLRCLELIEAGQYAEARTVVAELDRYDRQKADQSRSLIDEAERLRQSRAIPPAPQTPPPTSGVVQSTIVSSFTGKVFDHGNLFELQNEQVWKQADFYIHYHYAYYPRATIYRDGAEWKMKVDGVDRAVRVERIK